MSLEVGAISTYHSATWRSPQQGASSAEHIGGFERRRWQQHRWHQHQHRSLGGAEGAVGCARGGSILHDGGHTYLTGAYIRFYVLALYFHNRAYINGSVFCRCNLIRSAARAAVRQSAAPLARLDPLST